MWHSLLLALAGLGLLNSLHAGASVYYVATNGNASADGMSLSTAWPTISQAAKKMVSGDTVYIRGGTYREQITPANSGTATNSLITYAAYDGDKVVISGADIYTNWVKSSNSTWQLSWTTNLDTGSTNFWYRREMVIVDGTVLTQVQTFGQVTPGTYYVDGSVRGTNSTAIWMRTFDDTPPSNHVVECAWRDPLFNASTSQGYFHVVGLTFTHDANNGGNGMASFYGPGNLVESNIFEWSGGSGIKARGSDGTYLYNIARNNGEEGWSVNITNTLIENCSSFSNNWRGYSIGNEAGGGKWAKCVNSTIRHFEAGFNNGPGIWLDWLNMNNVIEDCLCYSNEAAGIMLELASTNNTVRNCVIYGTRYWSYTGSGILVQDSSFNYLEHNTLINNEGVGIFIRSDNRATNEVRNAPGYNRVFNNVFQNNVTSPLFNTTNAKGGEITIGAYYNAYVGNQLDGNVYFHTNVQLYGRTFWWGLTGGGYDDLPSWQSITQYESNSVIGDPRLVNWQSLAGWHLASTNSPAWHRGVSPPVPVPDDYDGDPRPTNNADSGADQYGGVLLGVANGDFELPVLDPSAQTLTSPYVPSWFSGPAGMFTAWVIGTSRVTGDPPNYTTSQVCEIISGSYIYQMLGTYDSSQGNSLSWSFQQVTANNTNIAVAISFYAQTGSFTGAAGIDIKGAPGVTRIGTDPLASFALMPAGRLSRTNSGVLKLDGVADGTPIWVRIGATGPSGTYGPIDNVSVVVNGPPQAAITNPAPNAVFAAPATITINATASTSAGSVTNVEFYLGSNLVGHDVGSPYSLTLSNVPVGTYSLTAKAMDDSGGMGTSAAVNITVGEQGPYRGIPWAIPGRIEAENYDTGGEGLAYHDHDVGNQGGQYRNDDVDIKVTTDADGGYAVGWFNAGEWLAYSVNVASNASYDLQIRAGTLYSNRTFHIEFNGVDKTGEVPVPLVSVWDTYQTAIVGGVSLSAGQQVMRLVMGTNDYMDLNWLQVTPPNGPPQPWQSRDVGGVGVAGSASYTNGTFSVGGSGADIFGTADAFQFVYQAASGDCAIQARVAGIQNTNAWSKGGVMIRETLDAGSRNAAVFVTPSNGVNFQWRGSPGGNSVSSNVPGLKAPCWVRLARTGDSFVGYYSGNGASWTAISTQTVAMASNVCIGLGVTSHVVTNLCVGTLDNVTVTPWTPLLRDWTLSGGQFALHATVLQGWTCVLETSTNLAGWRPVLTNTAVATGDLVLTNGTTGSDQQRFYRVRFNP